MQRASKDNLINADEIRIINAAPKARPNIVTTTRIPNELAEEFRQLKHNVAGIESDKKIKTLLLCCSTEGEGNTTVLINFARVIAAEGEQVLVVDANLRNPAIHRFLNLEQKNGFTDVLLGRAAVSEVIKKTTISNLFAITCGTRSTTPSSLLESDQLLLIIEQLKPLADWVLFDAPPVIACNDARTLAARMDGVIMVIEAEKTRCEVVNSARQRMESSAANILGAVLNKRQMHIPGWAYNKL
jgi:capsular exopolysaccharide synthesis family protein